MMDTETALCTAVIALIVLSVTLLTVVIRQKEFIADLETTSKSAARAKEDLSVYREALEELGSVPIATITVKDLKFGAYCILEDLIEQKGVWHDAKRK